MPFTSESASRYGKMGARQPYEVQKENEEKMNRILARDLALMEKIQEAKKLDEKQVRKLAILKERVLKIMDKLHASKTQEEIKHTGEVSVKIESLTAEEKELLTKIIAREKEQV